MRTSRWEGWPREQERKEEKERLEQKTKKNVQVVHIKVGPALLHVCSETKKIQIWGNYSREEVGPCKEIFKPRRILKMENSCWPKNTKWKQVKKSKICAHKVILQARRLSKSRNLAETIQEGNVRPTLSMPSEKPSVAKKIQNSSPPHAKFCIKIKNSNLFEFFSRFLLTQVESYKRDWRVPI